jgi:hypothetical protein
VVGLVSGSSGYYCPSHGRMSCPICGSELVVVNYFGKEPDKLAFMRRDDFCCFLGCIRVDLHDKVVDGVNYRGKVYVKPVFHGRDVGRRKRMP